MAERGEMRDAWRHPAPNWGHSKKNRCGLIEKMRPEVVRMVYPASVMPMLATVYLVLVVRACRVKYLVTLASCPASMRERWMERKQAGDKYMGLGGGDDGSDDGGYDVGIKRVRIRD